MITIPRAPARGDDILTWARAIVRTLRAFVPQDSEDIVAEQQPNSVKFRFRKKARAGGDGGSTIVVPWQPVQVNTGTVETPVMKWRINHESQLWLDEAALAPQEILDFDMNIDDAAADGHKIWLEIRYAAFGVLDEVELMVGEPWTDWPMPLEVEGFDVKKVRFQIGHILPLVTAPGVVAADSRTFPITSTLKLVLDCDRHLMLIWRVVAGYGCQMPFPWHRRDY